MSILIISGLVLLGGLAFLVWMCIHVAGLILRAIFGLGRSDRNAAAGTSAAYAAAPDWSSCANPGCRAASPVHARFCRRCGHAFGSSVRGSGVPMRYVA